MTICERTVRRDWNNPALFAILLANESTPTVAVMKEAREKIKALMPSVFFSMPGPEAPDHKLSTMKQMFDEAGFDFYTDSSLHVSGKHLHQGPRHS